MSTRLARKMIVLSLAWTISVFWGCDQSETDTSAARSMIGTGAAAGMGGEVGAGGEAGMGGTASLDADMDGHADETDNCPEVANEDQADADEDGLGMSAMTTETAMVSPMMQITAQMWLMKTSWTSMRTAWAMSAKM